MKSKSKTLSKTLYSDNTDGIRITVRCHHNPKSDHNTISSGFGIVGISEIYKNNKKCPLYLGTHIAERVLSKIFNNVTIMVCNNPGYDFICDKGYKVDVKSSTFHKKSGAWAFSINKNTVADYFLCLAFDNIDNLNPQYLWLIPGKILNNKTGTTISISTINKWSDYEITEKLDKVIECCNIMKGDINAD